MKVNAADDTWRMSLTPDVPPLACPYQVKGRLPTGEDAVICTRAQGSCPLQEVRPMTGGHHTALCRLREEIVSDWQQDLVSHGRDDVPSLSGE